MTVQAKDLSSNPQWRFPCSQNFGVETLVAFPNEKVFFLFTSTRRTSFSFPYSHSHWQIKICARSQQNVNDNFVQMETVTPGRSNRSEREKWSTPEGRPFLDPEYFLFIRRVLFADTTGRTGNLVLSCLL